MEILQVCPRFHPFIGGVETHVKNISERLAKKHNVTVFSVSPFSYKIPEKEESNGVNIVRFKGIAPNNAYYFPFGMAKKIRKYPAEIIHGHAYHAFPLYYAAKSKGKRKFVVTPHFHGISGHKAIRSILHKFYKPFGKQIFKKADQIICVSKYEMTLLTQAFDINHKKLNVIPNGINLGLFEKRGKKESDFKKLLCVSRLEEYKGIHYLIEALPLLDDRYIVEIVGTGPHKETLKRLAMRKGVTDRVRFFEGLSRQALIEKYYEASLFILLSKYEAFGITVGEALASGTPCIVANSSALLEWVDGKNCIGINYPIELKKLVDMIQIQETIKVEGVKLWDWGMVVEELEKVYSHIAT